MLWSLDFADTIAIDFGVTLERRQVATESSRVVFAEISTTFYLNP